ANQPRRLAGEIPFADFSFWNGRCQVRAIWTERHVEWDCAVTCPTRMKCQEALTGSRIPQSDGSIQTGGREARTVRTERKPLNFARTSRQQHALLTGDGVPQSHSPIITHARHDPSVRQNTTALTAPEWPLRTSSVWPDTALQRRTVPSSAAVATCKP